MADSANENRQSELAIDAAGPSAGPAPRFPTLTTDTPCTRCGYNLRGLHAAGRCPECGLEIGPSLRSHLLIHADARWLGRIAASLKFTTITVAIMAVSMFVAVPLARAAEAPPELLDAFAGLFTLLAPIGGFCIWMSTSQQRGVLPPQRVIAWRFCTRLAIIAGPVVFVAHALCDGARFLQSTNNWWLHTMVIEWFRFVERGLLLAGSVAYVAHLAELARRAEAEKIRRALTIVRQIAFTATMFLFASATLNALLATAAVIWPISINNFAETVYPFLLFISLVRSGAWVVLLLLLIPLLWLMLLLAAEIAAYRDLVRRAEAYR